MFNYAYAQSATQQPSLFASFIPLILIFVIFYFLLIRPQQKKQKQHQILLAGIKKGDQIITSGGILCKVVKADTEYLTVEISPNVNVKIFRATVSDVLNKK
ncbi:MAG: preprotein translocase subunit YajC [Rickettsiales bacterium]|nr:preprotein translocase subunit YajC [Rickettsiales bacterium]OUV52836.1 MAG: preprotein translocase subunit YajC [Rickettsiales bacterium TMED127]|tara:strand:- start:19417 stop:19719 length:303 start_codon:yes stop_codon:yes gene_type:complete